MTISIKDSAGSDINIATGSGDGSGTPYKSPVGEAFGAKADSAASSDTGTFSFMAFVKRLLQRFTLGQTTSSASLPVTIASDQSSIPMQPSAGALTDRSGTITTGGTSQQLAASNSSRKYLLIINMSSNTLWINFGTAAVQDSPSIPLAAKSSYNATGGIFVMEGSFVSNQAVNIIGATTSHAFIAKEG